MPLWVEVAVALQFAATLAILAILLFRSFGRRSGIDLLLPKVDRLGDLASRSETKVDQLAMRHDQFATASVQSASALRAEISSALSTEFSNLRQEVLNSITQIGSQTHITLEDLRSSTSERLDKLTGDLTTQQSTLRESINLQLSNFQGEVTARFNEFQKTQSELGSASREAIDGTLSRLSRDIREAVNDLKTDVNNRIAEMVQQTAALKESAESQQTVLRQTIEQRLDKLNESNAKKLDEMRETVDEKLHKTLETRLTQSFGLVTDQLGKVQTGLGEMKDLAANVGDLKRVLSNVSTRGGLGNTMLGRQLEQALAPNQFDSEVRIRPSSDERVDYVIRLPYSDDEPVLLPIDSKFPKEDWERLEEAAKVGDAQAMDTARKGLESRIKAEAKKIADKYICPPITTNFAFMYLPSEALFLEVLRIPGLVDELQLKYRVSVAGPTNFMAILNSLQMGFKTLAIQKKGSEVWKLLGATKSEFEKFGVLMNRVEKQVGTVQNTLHDVGVRTRAINKTLGAVEMLEIGPRQSAALLEGSAPGNESQEDDLEEVSEYGVGELDQDLN